MSATATQWRAPVCESGKAAYRTQGKALNALAHIAIEQAQATAPRVAVPVGAYHCACGAWHLTRKHGDVNVDAVLGCRA